jgi:SPP1 gp7 family putative phage head morphogenesis protein
MPAYISRSAIAERQRGRVSMTTPTNAEVLRRYIRRGLSLIRVANGMTADTFGQLASLSVELRAALAEHSIPPSGRLQQAAVVREIEALILSRYARITATQIAGLRELTTLEAAFAQRASAYAAAPSRETLARAMTGMLFSGAPMEAHWQREAQNIAFRVGSEMRVGWNAGDDATTLRGRVLGQGRPGAERGGVMQGARDNARRLTHTGTQRASQIGRAATHRANGANAFRWVGVLDSRICPNCGMRNGKLYTLDGEPIGHSVAMVQEPPLHFFCRCMLVPERHKGGTPEDSGPRGESFETYLNSLSADEQSKILGAGRAELYREGKITLHDLIGQNGLVLPLRALKGD